MPRYTEAIDCLYSSNTMVIRNLHNMHFVPPLLDPQRLNTIRSLFFKASEPTPAEYSVEWDVHKDFQKDWAVVWRTLAGMRGLRVLHVVIQSLHNLSSRKSLLVALEPVEKGDGREGGTFSLHLPVTDDGWWNWKFARVALAEMEGIYRIDDHNGPVQLPAWAR